MKLNECRIQIALYYRFNAGWKVACPNIYYYWTWECDVLALTKSDYLIEYEIKISKADFDNDIKSKSHKHLFLKNQQNAKSPNRFYYVVPVELEDKITIPEYAGLITVRKNMFDDYYDVRVKKKAPKLHNRKPSEKSKERIFHSCYYRAWSYMVSATEKLRIEEYGISR